MKRKQITQIINVRWFPKFLKTLVAEFLSWFVLKVNATKPFIPVIEDILNKTYNKRIINIEFGIGAGIETVKPFLNDGVKVDSIAISNFNTSEKGVYLFVNSFHQLNASEAKKILQNIEESGNPVVVVEGNNDSLWQIVGMTVFVPLTVLLTAFFVKPFRISRIIFTYLIPILPIVIVIDGCIALLKLYNPTDLLALTSSLENNNYEWKAGKNDNGRGGKIMYLTGRKLQ
ncbi:hypothetical protein EQG68_13160 [Flavobacterium piscinae]|uniref:Uncharacterized protein n=1 Tax=Flavobacterium piscinae TaxID=2506424 RepID=A0A4Q1KJQ2_9FLAO|nr:hypothetical protein [Flavobacterium piscinae]RXR29429.1 hypothetical protein EQG68_13160 [Flavobacterium piscinae]